ncbi:MAG: aminopeptidase N [Actinomycetaceae bacterium]|nr:aminopeptidase N [Actinomycetaceae bacterium]
MPGLNLTRDEAMERSSFISNVTYDVTLDLTKGDKTFSSITRMTFDAEAGKKTFIDLVADSFDSIILNGTRLDEEIYRNYRLELPELKAHNTLEVSAQCHYMHTGEGMHRFVDPEDNEAYVYTQFEVPDARRVFACFEQPDLKATFTFHVTVPDHWTVLSNSATPTPHENDGKRVFDFEPTDKISTYITAIVAGPYVGKTGELTSSDGRTIPLGVYCRASLEKYLDAEVIMDITRQGFTFFEDMYGRAYPFSKYDQIFVPEYNAGAMENAGCITFRDEYLFRSKPTEAMKEARANTILHELAHMWFGDLVTMKWWNDLWLNESFAEFMSYQCLAYGTQWKDAWTSFIAREAWGLRCDQLPTTHPIVAEIRDLADVEVNFDGITYSKGAAVLRQLVAYVGLDHFTEGIRRYIEKHAWKNTTLPDLLTELEAASGRDLSSWTKVWLEEAGITLLRPDIEVDDEGVITRCDIVQELPMEGTSYRPHRLIVSGYSLVDNEFKKVFCVEQDVEGERTVVEGAKGQNRPDVLIVNDENLAYAKVRLDEDSFECAKNNFAAFTSPMPRAILMANAWDATRDGDIAATDYIELALANVAVETSSAIVRQSLANIVTAFKLYLAPEHAHEVRQRTCDRLVELLEAAEPGSDTQLQLAHTVITCAHENGLDIAEGLLSGTRTYDGLDVDTDLRWHIVETLVAAGRGNEEIIDNELRRDHSMAGKEYAASCRAALPTGKNRRNTFDAIVQDQSLPNGTLEAMCGGYSAHLWRNTDGAIDNVNTYFNCIEDVWNDRTLHIGELIVEGMFPIELQGYVTDIAAKADAWLDSHPDAPRALRRIVLELWDGARRASICQQADR